MASIESMDSLALRAIEFKVSNYIMDSRVHIFYFILFYCKFNFNKLMYKYIFSCSAFCIKFLRVEPYKHWKFIFDGGVAVNLNNICVLHPTVRYLLYYDYYIYIYIYVYFKKNIDAFAAVNLVSVSGSLTLVETV